MTDNIMATLTQEGVDEEFAKLDALVAQLKKKAGSASQRKAEAKMAIMGGSVEVEEADIEVLRKLVNVYDLTSSGKALVNLGDLAVSVCDALSWANQVGDEAVTAYLKAQGSDEDLTALKKAYEDQKTRCEALLTVAAVIPGLDELVKGKVIPTVRAPRSTGGSKPAGSSFGHFYRILPSGEKKYQSGGQDKLSSMAWYFGALMVGKPGEGDRYDGKGIGVGELEAFLRANVTDSPIGKPWEYVVSTDAGDITFGFEVTGTTPDEEE